MYQWYDDGGPGKISVSINLSEQVATVKRGGREVGWSYRGNWKGRPLD